VGDAMTIKVMLFGHHARLLPPGTSGNATSVDFEDGSTITDVLDALGVPPDGRSYVQLNGTRADLSATLADGDEVRVIVPLGGG
jgi:sulfur carrier protein ThiS